MSLRGAPLIYLFIDVASIAHQRELLEDCLRLPVIESDLLPPHDYHGLIKYDAGNIILSLNLCSERKFERNLSDGLIAVFDVNAEMDLFTRLALYGYSLPRQSGDVFTDDYRHHYIFCQARSSIITDRDTPPHVRELRLITEDVQSSVRFYAEVLDLELIEETKGEARFATATVDLVLQQGSGAPDRRPITYYRNLTVFCTNDIHEMSGLLISRGLTFKTRPSLSEIGWTARFADPSGHTFCLYEPSLECLSWDSGPKVNQLMQHYRHHVSPRVSVS